MHGVAHHVLRQWRVVTRRVLLIVISALVLTACRLDVEVDVAIAPDGTGTVTVHAVADAELAAKVPGLVDDLRFDDAIAAGWTIDGPTTDDTGEVEITLTHTVASPQELANVLNSIGPPFTSMAAARTTVEDQTSNAIDGVLTLPNGFESFADADLVAAAGGLPFNDEFSASATTPAESMSVTFRVALPGELVSTTGTETDPDVFEWTAPLDGIVGQRHHPDRATPGRGRELGGTARHGRDDRPDRVDRAGGRVHRVRAGRQTQRAQHRQRARVIER